MNIMKNFKNRLRLISVMNNNQRKLKHIKKKDFNMIKMDKELEIIEIKNKLQMK